MVSSLVIALIGFTIFMILDSFSNLVSSIAAFFYFLWVYANIKEQSSLATFYLILGLLVIVGYLIKQYRPRNSGGATLLGFTFKGFSAMNLVGIGVGITIFFVMRFLQAGAGANAIIGVPKLAISAVTLAPLTMGILGVFENRAFFLLFEILLKLPIQVLQFAGVFGSILITSLFFAFFHISVYLYNIGSLMFAAIVFMIWMGSYLLLNDDAAANTSHFLWNLSVTLSRQLAIV